MADSDDDRSDVGNGDDEAGFDPTTRLDQMSDKDRKKWEKNLRSWRIVLDFLFRHISIATFRYNCFEREELTQLLISLEKGESLRLKTKLKKGELATVNSFKSMRDCADLLAQHKFLNDANRLKRFLDIIGRLKGLSLIAGGFLKALKKAKVKGIDKLKVQVDYWKGFCVRSFDYGELQFRNVAPDSFNELEKKFLVWPTVVRTSLNVAQKFLKTASQSTGLDLLSPEPQTMQAHMQAAEFVVAAKIEQNLFNRVVQETKSFLVGNPLITGQSASPLLDNAKSGWTLPDYSDIDPGLLKPITDDGLLLELPADPPKEKKKGKKGKGKKGRGSSASSHKSGKKKKKKK